MGHMVSGIAEKDDRIEIVAGVDAFGKPFGGYPVYGTLAEIKEEADVVIDFSTAAAVDGLLDYCAEKGLPVVLCTTGLSEEQTAHMHKTAEKVAVLKSANMSLGVNMLLALLKQAAGPLAAAGFDIEVVEKHHRMKLDSPSGTALALADAANSALNNEYDYVFLIFYSLYGITPFILLFFNLIITNKENSCQCYSPYQEIFKYLAQASVAI